MFIFSWLFFHWRNSIIRIINAQEFTTMILGGSKVKWCANWVRFGICLRITACNELFAGSTSSGKFSLLQKKKLVFSMKINISKNSSQQNRLPPKILVWDELWSTLMCWTSLRGHWERFSGLFLFSFFWRLSRKWKRQISFSALLKFWSPKMCWRKDRKHIPSSSSPAKLAKLLILCWSCSETLCGPNAVPAPIILFQESSRKVPGIDFPKNICMGHYHSFSFFAHQISQLLLVFEIEHICDS